MATTNGKNGKWTLWIAGCMFTIVVVITLPAMAKGIIDNDRRNTEEHVDIRKEMKQDKEDLMKEVKEVSKDVKKVDDNVDRLAIEIAKITQTLKSWEPVRK